VADSCVHGNEHVRSIKGGDFFVCPERLFTSHEKCHSVKLNLNSCVHAVIIILV
jgi:hypothetical protein